MEDQDLKTLYVLDQNTPRPPVNPNYIRLYEHYCCPFCEKVRLTLAAKGVKYQKVEIDLGKKP